MIKKLLFNFYTGYSVNLLNLPTLDELSQIIKFLAHHKVGKVKFTYFQPNL